MGTLWDNMGHWGNNTDTGSGGQECNGVLEDTGGVMGALGESGTVRTLELRGIWGGNR